MSRVHDTIVVGGGISGLAYAHARGDADVLVLEASGRAGGLVQTGRVDDTHYETGPEALQDNAPETLAMLDELGLAAVPAADAARNRYVLREAPPSSGIGDRRDMDAVEAAADAVLDARPELAGRLVALPTGPGAFLKSPLLTRRGKLRALTEPFRRGDRALEGSVADFIRHRLGAEVLDWLVDPFVTGIYAGDPEKVSVEAAFPMLHEMVSEHGSLMKGLKARARARRAADPDAPRGPPSLMTVEGGLGRIPEAIAARLDDRLRLSCPVEGLIRDGDGWRVDAGGSSLRCGRLVLASSVGAAAGLLAQDQPALSQTLGEMTAESVVSVAHLWQREDVVHPLDGFGYLVPSRLGQTYLGTLFSSSIHPPRCPEGTVLLRTLMGGAHHPELAQTDPDHLRAIVAREVGPVLGLSAEPLWSTVTVWNRVLPRYDLGQPARQKRIEAVLSSLPGLSILGNHRRGISVNALVEASRECARAHTTGS